MRASSIHPYLSEYCTKLPPTSQLTFFSKKEPSINVITSVQTGTVQEQRSRQTWIRNWSVRQNVHCGKYSCLSFTGILRFKLWTDWREKWTAFKCRNGEKKKKICGTKHSSFKLSGSTPLYWKPIITVTESNPTCEMAEKIVFLRFDMQNQIMESW